MLTKINGEVLGVADACKRVMELAAAKKPSKIEPIYNSLQKVQSWQAQLTEMGKLNLKGTPHPISMNLIRGKPSIS